MPTENLESNREKIEVEEVTTSSDSTRVVTQQPKVSTSSTLDTVKDRLNEIDKSYESQYPVYEDFENSLPDLRDYVDTLEFQEDSRADDLLKIINKLEDELLVKAIEFIKK